MYFSFKNIFKISIQPNKVEVVNVDHETAMKIAKLMMKKHAHMLKKLR